MTTKTDFHAIQELREKYAPKVRGIVSGEEAKVEQARRAADAVGGALYGITSDGRKVLLL